MSKDGNKTFNVESGDSLEKIEEEIIEAADKAGKKNVIVNIFSYPGEKLKRRWNVRYKFNKKHLVMDAIIAGIVLTLVGLNIFWLYGGFHYFSDKLELKISSNEKEFTSGQPVTFDIEYNNKNKYELEEAVLSLVLPANFVLEQVDRVGYDYDHNIIKLGDLASGANGSIEIEGQLLGAVGDEQILAANVNYFKTDKKGNRLWGQFTNSVFKRISLTQSYLDVSMPLPEKAVFGQYLLLNVKLLNNSADLTYDLLKLRVADHDFSFVNVTPGKTEEFQITATVKSEEVYNPEIILSWEKNGLSFLQKKVEFSVPVVQPKFSVVSSVNNGEAANPGEKVEITLAYGNNGKYTIENAEIHLVFSGDYWNLKQIDGEVEKIFVNDVPEQELVWTFKELPKLALVQPNEGGEIKFKVGTKNYAAKSNDFSLRTRADLKYKLNGQAVTAPGEPVETKLNSNLSVKAYPIYYTASGDQLGRGPLPPKVGQETKYWVFFQLVNDINPVENVAVKIISEGNVVFTGKSNVPVGDPVEINDSARMLTWKISQIPVNPEGIGFAVEVAIVPTLPEKGTYPLLLSSINISGLDSETGKLIDKTLAGPTTKLVYDKKGKTKDGVVK
ncbi:MAG: hypothetical protein AAB575_03775 [Patescibacteria group bacterium]